MDLVFILLVLFQIKHFLADYPLQNEYMLGKFKSTGWVKPLAAHCGAQAIFTFVIAAFALPPGPINALYALGLSALDFSIHFVMDRIKASPKMLGRFESLSKEQFKGLFEAKQLAESAHNHFSGKVGREEIELESARELVRIDKRFKSNKYFWWSLGFDQMVHHLTDILIVYLIFKILNTGI